jgi:hypothetical protein
MAKKIERKVAYDKQSGVYVSYYVSSTGKIKIDKYSKKQKEIVHYLKSKKLPYYKHKKSSLVGDGIIDTLKAQNHIDRLIKKEELSEQDIMYLEHSSGKPYRQREISEILYGPEERKGANFKIIPDMDIYYASGSKGFFRMRQRSEFDNDYTTMKLVVAHHIGKAKRYKVDLYLPEGVCSFNCAGKTLQRYESFCTQTEKAIWKTFPKLSLRKANIKIKVTKIL